MDRNDVLVTVQIEIGNSEAVASRDRHASRLQVVDDVFTPRDKAAVSGTRTTQLLPYRQPAFPAVGTTAHREQCRGDPWNEGGWIAMHSTAAAISAQTNLMREIHTLGSMTGDRKRGQGGD